MANNTIKRVWNANKLVSIEDLSGMTFQGENGGHTFEVSGVDDSGSAVSISGTVTAVFLRADNAAISISGSVSSGKAVATLTQNCYTVPGRFMFTIFVAANSQKTAIYSATGNVARTDGVATGSVPPLVTDSIQTGSITVSGDATVASLDVTSRRCFATLSSAGWYRVCKTADASGTIIDFSIGRPYGSAPAEAHRISFYVVGGGKSAFLNETSDTNTLFVDKIRCTYGGGFMYFDVHYNSSASSEVLVYFDVYGKGQANGTSVSMGLTSVADSPSGETVLTEYTFAANTNVARTFFTPTFSGTANPSVSNASCFYSIKDGVMYAGGRFNIESFTSGGTTVLFTLPVSLGIADRSAETIGTVFTATKTLQLRSYGADVYITDAAGSYSGGLLNTGYWSFQIVAPIYN